MSPSRRSIGVPRRQSRDSGFVCVLVNDRCEDVAWRPLCARHRFIACEGESVAPALQDLLHEFPDLIILIEGHVDYRGPIGHNERLPLNRAEAVHSIA